MFEEQNLSVDHNMLIMHTLQDAAAEFGFACLMHEKPFAGVNGSGKHNNWSIVGPDGKNWFNPGRTPHENDMFLFMLTAVIKAVDTHAALIRSSVATAGNDHRLGANEAPPAIMSIYLGEQLEDIIEQIDTGVSLRGKAGGGIDLIEIGVDCLPKIPKDVSDRNRTSPFAFTGNKFEFRAVGSAQSCAGPNTILNLTMAAALDEMCAAMEKRLAEHPPQQKDGQGHSREFHDALKAVLKAEVKAHKRVVFGGDGYSKEWEQEAARRGLPNLKSTPEALKALISPESVKLFSTYGVLTDREVESRYDVYRHAWEQTVSMEGGCALDLAKTFIMPVALTLESALAASVETAKQFGRDAGVRQKAFDQAANLVDQLHATIAKLEKALKEDVSKIRPAQAALRKVVDELEEIAPDRDWPFPCYGEMFFSSTHII